MARGFVTSADIPVANLIDGTDAGQLFKDYTAAVQEQNARQNTLVNLLSFKTTLSSDNVLQSIDNAEMEMASEFGQPVGIRPDFEHAVLGYGFNWYDLGTRFTARALADMTKEQADAITNAALGADNRTTFKGVLGAILNNTARVNPQGQDVLPLWNGDDMVPPDYDGRTFVAGHSHYVVSNTASLSAAGGQIAVDALIELVREHGYDANGGQLLLLVNRQEGSQIAGFRTVAGGGEGQFDYIPSDSAPARITTEVVVGKTPPAAVGDQPIMGSYGPALVGENNLIPAGYVVCVVTRGANNSGNVIGFREHVTPAQRGFRLVPGAGEYPLTNSFYTRGFGTGVRHRGAGAVMQVKAAGAYAVPAGF